MDDTALLAKSRHSMEDKLRKMQNYCYEYGMRVYKGKAKIFVIKCNNDNAETFV